MNVLDNIFNKKQCNFFLIAGPCVVENSKDAFKICKEIMKSCDNYNIPFIFKSSFKKANRSSLNSFTGIGDKKALEILDEIRTNFNVPVITDVHTKEDIDLAKSYVDILQIPAFLCRQTDLILHASKTKLPINIKKGQFMSASSMKFVVEKIESVGNKRIFITERGSSFGHNDLIVDFRQIHLMKNLNYPVIIDVTHSLQLPNQKSGVTGGHPEFIEVISKAGIASGVNGVFLETHFKPEEALSDSHNMLRLSSLDHLLKKLSDLYRAL
tara:strand:- start:1015 stop:1821 length:807 start_codon:yes stop_codon:yes gene_type:complete